VKRAPRRAWPKDIVEVRAMRPDPRAADHQPIDPHITQKISREQLDQALRRTKSGTRRAVRSEPALEETGANDEHESAFPGPRDDTDDGPLVTIVRIDSVDSIELEPVDPLSLPPIPSLPLPRRHGVGSGETRRLQITPRMAFAAGVAVTLLVLLAAFFGFFAGRVLPSSK
jgi:hypothetical protein